MLFFNIVFLFSSVFTLAECGCHFSLAASVFLTMAITMERYQAVYEPYKYMSRSRNVENHPFLVAQILYNLIIYWGFPAKWQWAQNPHPPLWGSTQGSQAVGLLRLSLKVKVGYCFERWIVIFWSGLDFQLILKL